MVREVLVFMVSGFQVRGVRGVRGCSRFLARFEGHVVLVMIGTKMTMSDAGVTAG